MKKSKDEPILLKPRQELMADALLRSRGFTVHARPTGQHATWERKGRVYFDTVALQIAQAEELAAKESES